MILLMRSANPKNSFQWISQIFKRKVFLVGLRSRSDISNMKNKNPFLLEKLVKIIQKTTEERQFLG
jgi:hypothetical protein